MNKCTIIYATESGTSQEVAEKLSRDLLKRIVDIKPRVIDIQNYNRLDLPRENLVVFVLSTAGHGEVPDSMKPFWSFLLIKGLPADSLSSVKFAVLGLGDSSYVTYNFAAKKLYQRLLGLGGQSLLRRGDADDQHDLGIDYEVDKWTSELVTALIEKLNLRSVTYIDHNRLPESKYKVVTACDATSTYEYQIPSHLSVGELKENKRITTQDWTQDVRHLEIAIPSSVSYVPGDVAYIFPKNPVESVNEIITLLGLNPNLLITDIQPRDSDLNQKPQLLHLPITVYDLFHSYFDITGAPKRYYFELLSLLSTNEFEKDRLLHFSSRDGSLDLKDYCSTEKRSYLEVLADFKSAHSAITLDYLFDLFPPIKPRPFSISSALSAHPQSIHITAGIHTFKALYRKITKTGLCSQWFTQLDIGTKVPFYIKESGAKLPKEPNTPIIMVGPGTGCAIFRAFLQERSQHPSPADMLFYFGCRHKAKDYLYQSEFESYQSTGVLSRLRVAFSRDSSDKQYVQSLMKEDSQLIWRLVHDMGAHFYISGSSGRMPKDVKNQLLFIIRENLKQPNQEPTTFEMAETYFKVNLEQTKRFITETW